MFKFIILFILLLCTTLFSRTVSSETENLSFLNASEQEYIKKNKVIKMCNNPNWEPVEYVTESYPKGIVVDILKLVEKKINVTFEYIPSSSWSQSQQFLKEKKCDILPAATKTRQREKYANFTKPYLSYQLAIITQNNKPFIRDIANVTDKTMSRKKGSGLIFVLKNKYPTIKIEETSGYEESLKKVSNGDVYYTVATLPVASHFISKFGLYNLHIAGYLDKRFDLSIAVRDDKTELLNILNKTLQLLPTSSIQKIENKWSNIKITEKQEIDYNILFIILLIMFFLLYRQIKLKQYHKELQKTNLKFEKMLNTTMEGILLLENDKIVDVNNAAVKMYGVKDKSDILGKSPFQFVANSSKAKALKNATLKQYDPSEIYLLRADGSTFPALMGANQLEVGSVVIRIVTAIDLTDIKQKEQMLSQSSKMAQMGEMIGNIAHQWRQPLSVITTAASGIKVKKEFDMLDDAELYKFLDSIDSNANHLSETIDTFRNFIKEKTILKEVIIQDRIDNALNIIDIRLKNQHINLINNIDYSNPIKVIIVLGELSQVIINIINNAIDVLIEKDVDNKSIEISLENHDEEYVTVAIEDNAGGIEKDILPKIFDPYFTTKHQSVGTGIGLYMSYDIIVNHMKGKLYAQNTQKGAKFFIKIPMEKRKVDRRLERKNFTPPDKRVFNRRE